MIYKKTYRNHTTNEEKEKIGTGYKPLAYFFKKTTGDNFELSDPNKKWCSEEIINLWTTAWGEGPEPFTEWFVRTYTTVHNEAEKHKILNFKTKKCFIFLLWALFVVQVVFLVAFFGACLYYQEISFDRDVFLASEAGLILSGFLFLLPPLKNIDVMKHQETWARHSCQRAMMELEMLRFIEKVEPYNYYSEDANKKMFMNRIIETEKDTMLNCREMLQKQEKGMGEEMSNVVPKV